MYNDLRDYIQEIDALGELRRINGADPVHELGGITEVAAGSAACPALLFDSIKGFPKGYRVFTNATTNPRRAALALGIDTELRPVEALKAWKEKRATLKPLPVKTISSAAFFDNSFEGGAVDLSTIPAPTWHRGDGGPYIGSGSLVVTGDPDSDWVNASIYRVQVHSRNHATVQFDHQGRHGAIIARKYWDQGKPCPIAIVNGQDPALFISGFEYLPEGGSEYEFAGAIKNTPLEVIKAPRSGLPIPAHAEIILEGVLLPPSEMTLPEGPFGEFTGYYAADTRPAAVMRVDAVYHRNDPILFGSPPLKPPRFHFGLPMRAASIWGNLETCGVTDVVGAWQHVSQLMTVVALKQRYAGHSKRAGLIAAANSYMGRLVVIVDEDVDPSSLADVMWAVTTRCEPSESVDIVRNAWSSSLDPRLRPGDRVAGLTSHSKMIIDACKPFDWIDSYPTASALLPSEAAEIEQKWRDMLSGKAT
ncbi:4-hydroxy-3-polyprenylbenzoate decarboxylase [Rhodopseudomonas rhenobacensis]|uniref:4-hydroxy-3-polyprenylbenzoate decarboxylase n=1 Tax=Rhodopseudomonas rhenobacensis TaxID=87461 RepID=A0A7W7Z6L5_9BRAD|nr:UbiD family decarboxylase [Rhodopseudomonas rhenobacensis]MBB5049001.1 4-hydroxy-3-polyprenylbenzoate decarboxylase [Rhodopseudomonas rhenobacensis]